MITQSTILSRPGWSKTILINLLGEPDKRRKQLGRSNYFCLYLLERVEAAEKSEQFHNFQTALSIRKLSAQKAVKTKTAKLMNAVTLMKICVNKIENVESQAIEAYNAIQRDEDYRATTNFEKKFLNRITVNFIRHELTEYDRSLEEIAGKAGVTNAVNEIRNKVYSAIADTYPEYDEECSRQEIERMDRNRFKAAFKLIQ